jgi:hypothetical protein
MHKEDLGMTNWHGGVLHEISPFGTGFIEDSSNGRVYGFHKSMLPFSIDIGKLEGALVRFQLNAKGAVGAVDLVGN